MSLNPASARFSYENALTIFWFPIISSASPFNSPRCVDCSVKEFFDNLVIFAAVKRDSGVRITTSSAIFIFIVSIKTSVPRIVIIPLKSCVNPWRRPSDIISISLTARLMSSPFELLSMNLSGTPFSVSKSSVLMSRMVLYESLFVASAVSHWKNVLTRTMPARTAASLASSLKSTAFSPTIKSTPLPIRIGTKRERDTPKREKITAANRYFL